MFLQGWNCHVSAPSLIAVTVVLGVAFQAVAWPGLNVKPLAKTRSELAPGTSGSYYQLSDNERKELVWMAKAANAAYPGVDKPFGYRSFSRAEWDAVAQGCDEIVYTGDGYFNVGSGLRGRLMVNMLNEGRVILALSGTDTSSVAAFTKDTWNSVSHATSYLPGQYRQALQIMNGVLSGKRRSRLWIVGHSLGGSLTTYLALNIPKDRAEIKCATFNGYGVSRFLKTGNEDVALASKRLRNVFCEGDLVYKIPARHFGPSYSIKVDGDWLEQHSLDNMLKVMIKHRTKWPGL